MKRLVALTVAGVLATGAAVVAVRAQVTLSPPISTITINGHTYTNSDWEANFQGTLAALGNDIAAVGGAFASRTPSGVGSKFLTLSGSFTPGNVIVTDANGDGIDGGPGGGGGGGGGGAGGETSLDNPTVSADPNDRWHTKFTVNFDGGVNLNTGFTNLSLFELTENAKFGLNSYGTGTNAKTSFFPLLMTGNYTAQGQRFMIGRTMNCWGNGDCFSNTSTTAFWGADIDGDEGQGDSISYVTQGGTYNQPQLSLTTINGAPTATTCNTTTTQAITGGTAAQAVSVASLTGCNVNDWIVVNPSRPTSSPNYEAVKITAVGGGKITGVFRLNQSSGVSIKPAKVVPVASTFSMGQGRMLVNRSASSYITGKISSIFGGGFTGQGTNWTNNMVGDDGNPNIGCISLDADTLTEAPFNGGGAHGPLHSWYAIKTRNSTTDLAIFTTSVAGDAAYHGYGPGSGDYTISPCSEVLRIEGNSLILMTTAAPWLNGDTVEEAITPFPDVTIHDDKIAVYTAGGNLRSWWKVRNVGRRTFDTGIQISGQMAAGADPDAFNNGIAIDSSYVGAKLDTKGAAFQLVSDYLASDKSDIVWGPVGGRGLTPSRDKAIGYANINGSSALMLHSTNGTGRCADGGAMCLGVQNYWANYIGYMAMGAPGSSGLTPKFRFYDSISVAGDPSTATRYVDILYHYNGDASSSTYTGLLFTDNLGHDLLKLDLGGQSATLTGAATITGNTTINSDLTVGGWFRQSGNYDFSVTAAGTDWNSATVLTKQINLVDTAASTTVGVRLPSAATVGVGNWVEVYNDGPLNSFHIYGSGSGQIIDGNAHNVGVVLSKGYYARFYVTAANTFKSYRHQIVRAQ